MSRSFGLVDSKVQEAEYFLYRVLDSKHDFFGVQCDTVAFTASARSVTFAMQASLKGIPEFDDWYAEKQDQMRADPLSKFFHDFRRISQHIGDNAVVGGSTGKGRTIYHFGPLPELKKVPEVDVATACKTYFRSILELVYECYTTFPTIINGQWYFTREHFESQGLTIEDAEEKLGLRRGWSSISGLDEDICWKYLRQEADGCNIQRTFEGWLGKRVPHPDDEV